MNARTTRGPWIDQGPFVVTEVLGNVEWAASARQRAASIDLAVWRAQWAAAGYAALTGSQQQGPMGSIAVAQMTSAVINGAMSAAAGG